MEVDTQEHAPGGGEKGGWRGEGRFRNKYVIHDKHNFNLILLCGVHEKRQKTKELNGKRTEQRKSRTVYWV